MTTKIQTITNYDVTSATVLFSQGLDFFCIQEPFRASSLHYTHMKDQQSLRPLYNNKRVIKGGISQ